MISTSYEDWSDFYSGSPDQTYISGASRITPTAGNAHVKCTSFKNLSPSQSGGAIYCSSVSLLFLAEETSFISCTPTGQGGAMYLCITGQSILSKVCGFCCLAKSSSCQFDYIQVPQDVSKENKILHSSICRSEKESYRNIIRHDYGKQSYSSVNVSHNKINDYGIQSENDGISGILSIEYCSFANNTASTRMIFSLYDSVQKQIYFCNVISNEIKSSELGLIRTEGIMKIGHSCILGNK